ncbi:hypothetical protein M0R45_036708 [Rubus argutus]|uniref:Uncharacterized protein n=1 Tax=Rubus argutus TaxID=59490 RepID=A0AAW1W112_RUBAR
MARELRLAVEVSMDYRKNNDFVNAEEIQRGIRQVMDHDGDTRKRVKETREMSKRSSLDGWWFFLLFTGAFY